MARPPELDVWVAEVGRRLAAPPLPRGQRATNGTQDPKWIAGDYLLTIPPEHLEAIAAELNVPVSRLKVLRDVSEQFPPDKRVRAAWSTHRDCRKKKDKLKDGMVWSRTTDNLSVQERVDLVRRLLWDPEVKKIIDAELTKSRSDRRNARFRVVHDDLARERKLVEALRRDMITAKRPFEASLDAELDLLKYAEYVYAVVVSFDQMDAAGQARVVHGLRRLQEQMDVAFDKIEPLRSPAPIDPITIDGESWQPQSGRELDSRVSSVQ